MPVGGTIVKSKVALTLSLAVVAMLGVLGAALAIPGSSGNGSAAVAQYAGPVIDPDPGCSTDAEAAFRGASAGAHASAGTVSCPDTHAGTLTPAVSAQAADQIAADEGTGSLPFSGFAVIGMLALGVVLTAAGLVVRWRTSSPPQA